MSIIGNIGWWQPGTAAPPVSSVPIIMAKSKANQNDNQATTITVPKPFGTVEGDYLFVCIGIKTGTTTTDWDGFTEISGSTNGGTTLAIAYKIAGASEPADYTFTWGTDDRQAAIMLRINDQNLTDAINVVLSNGSSSNVTEATALSILTTVDNSLLLTFYGARTEDSGMGLGPGDGPIGMDEVDVAEGGGFAFDLAAAQKDIVTQGNTGDQIWAGQSAPGGQYTAFSVAIAPA